MQRKWSKNKMREIVHSGLGLFDKQVSCLNWDGNVIASTQLACYVRPYSEVSCNGAMFSQGHLRDWDMSTWHVGPDCREFIKKYIGWDKQCWWTQFFYHNTAGDKVVLLEIVAVDNVVEFTYHPKGQTSKQKACVKFLKSYVNMGLLDERKKTMQRCMCMQPDPNCEWSTTGTVYYYEVAGNGSISIYSNDEYPITFICSLEHFIRYYEKPTFTGDI
jgi:hypothetical protein